MEQDAFTAPCGCIWRGRQHRQACVAWFGLATERDRLRQAEDLDSEGLRRIEEQMHEHLPPWMVGG